MIQCYISLLEISSTYAGGPREFTSKSFSAARAIESRFERRYSGTSVVFYCLFIVRVLASSPRIFIWFDKVGVLEDIIQGMKVRILNQVLSSSLHIVNLLYMYNNSISLNNQEILDGLLAHDSKLCSLCCWQSMNIFLQDSSTSQWDDVVFVPPGFDVSADPSQK